MFAVAVGHWPHAFAFADVCCSYEIESAEKESIFVFNPTQFTMTHDCDYDIIIFIVT